MLIIGIGSSIVGCAASRAKRHSGSLAAAAAAFNDASDSAKTALAPSREGLVVQSAAPAGASSMLSWSDASSPVMASARTSRTFATARCTPFPPYRLSPSRSSRASWAAVDAPEGALSRIRLPHR
jgi:hypothetical protein